jgi:hypothetical protein
MLQQPMKVSQQPFQTSSARCVQDARVSPPSVNKAHDPVHIPTCQLWLRETELEHYFRFERLGLIELFRRICVRCKSRFYWDLE